MLGEYKERAQQTIANYLEIIKVRIFGVNNERLDFVLDTFNKLAPPQKNGVVGGGIASIVLLVFLGFYFYYSRVNIFETDLNNTFIALRELKALKNEDLVESEHFDKLVETIKRKISDLTFKPFLEKVSQETKTPIKGINEKSVDFEETNPLSKVIKQVQLELRITKISIPRLLDFLIEIEKSGHYLRVQDLKITGQYGNKLFFDVELMIRGYKVL